ncbi:MAG: C40 family peptidase [Lachnospiraceae bacterium]|nr:C40 family peptidase [Lachnospiraceae bacterium]
MIRLGNVISISKAAAIQTAGLATVFFIVFMASFTSSVAHDKDLAIHENTRIRNVINFDPSLTATDSEIALAEVSGDRVAEAEYGANVDVISPEAELLIDIDKTLGGEIGIACVDSYVNVRTSPDASAEATAKVYDGAVVFVEEREGEWCKIKSGNAEGYVMSQYFMFGNQLAQSILISEPYTREELLVDKSYTVGITLEEEEEIRLAKEEEERKERARIAAEQEAARKKAMEAGNANSYEDASQLRKDLCDFACQYVGLKYVNGGNSLETGTDCSGFTKLIYAHFGYGLDRTPSGQYNNNGRLVSYAEAQPGDVIIYGKNGVCTHAAIYLGDGKIIHAANSRQNTYIGNATYNTIMGVKNIID